MTPSEMLEPQPKPIRTKQSASVVDFLLPRAVFLAGSAGEARLVALLERRREQGAQHYPTELHSHNGRRAQCDMLQELVDALLYAAQDVMEHEPECVGPRSDRCARIGSMVAAIAAELEVQP